MIDYSDFIVLLARQRSGTHALRSVLESHPDFFGVEEPFHLKSADEPNPNTEDTNYFSFLKKRAQVEPLALLPVDHEALFLEYLAYLRTVTSRRFILLDVKPNTAHHILRAFQPLIGAPYLFELIVKHGLRTFVLTRAHYLRYFVSVTKANTTSVYHVPGETGNHRDGRVRLNVAEMRLELNRCEAEDALVRDFFGRFANDYLHYDYTQKCRTWDYADIFAEGGRVAPEFLDQFSQWLAIANQFAPEPVFTKQATLTLSETIENFEEVKAALKGTRFSYCLQEEKPGTKARTARKGSPLEAALSFFPRLLDL